MYDLIRIFLLNPHDQLRLIQIVIDHHPAMHRDVLPLILRNYFFTLTGISFLLPQHLLALGMYMKDGKRIGHHIDQHVGNGATGAPRGRLHLFVD